MKPVTIVEIDIPYCDLTYGTAPCTASIPTTGSKKCFNLIRGCQDRANFTEGTKTLRFCISTPETTFYYFDQPVISIPSVLSVRITPAVINPGVDVGQRESITVTFKDHPHSDVGLDKYLGDRAYDPYTQGTFWGRMRARIPSMEGYTLRLIRGVEGQQLQHMDRYTYVIDSVTAQGDTVSLVAKDVIILTDKKRSQAPRISNGVLAAGIDDNDGSLTLSPSGIGNAEYPASGKVALGGKEICSFTRSGDTLTITRAQNGTTAQAHDEGDSVQLCLEYVSENPAEILVDLLTRFTENIDLQWISINEWVNEVNQYVGRLYSALIAEPTPVVDLVNELIEQVGLVFWWDAKALKLRLRTLRPVTAAAKTYSESHFLDGTFAAREQPAKRISEVWTYYGLRNPLEPLDEHNNYKAAIATVDADSAEFYKEPAIKKIYSRWIADNNRPAASRLNGMLLSRYRDAPRKFTFSLFADVANPPTLAEGFLLSHHTLQDDEGSASTVAAQAISLEIREDRYIVDAQEVVFVAQDDLEEGRVVYIDSTVFNINLRSLHDAIYLAPQSGDEVTFIISDDAVVASTSTSSAALNVGDWPSGVTVNLENNGTIIGKGGSGGFGWYSYESDVGGEVFVSGDQGGEGGLAFYTREAINLENNGMIAGGGGGGGGRNPPYPTNDFGGDGAGSVLGGSVTLTGTSGATGSGAGGGPGLPGSDDPSAQSPGGAAGTAIDGVSYITFSTAGAGDVRGAQVN